MNEPARHPDALVISAFTATTAVGHGREALAGALRAGRSGLMRCAFAPRELAPRVHEIDTWIGAVEGVDAVELPPELARFDCRNNRLAWLALAADGFIEQIEALKQRHGAERIALILGTSTSGLLQAEAAYHARAGHCALPESFRYPETLNNFSLAAFVAAATGLRGPAHVISTACSSSAKVFAAAARLIQAGLADAAVVGGIDSLCLTTLYGFGSLELLSREPCRPFAPDRSGISIGEGGGFAMLERRADAPQVLAVLCGWGESSDAHHMSSPHPEGLGAQLAMRGALERAGLAPNEVGYINLHGTATRANDVAEGRAVYALFGDAVPTSSTKAWFGHLLGAAGIAEAVVTLVALIDAYLPQTLGTRVKDPECPNWLLTEPHRARIDYALTNSFGFGGSNCSLVFGRGDR